MTQERKNQRSDKTPERVDAKGNTSALSTDREEQKQPGSERERAIETGREGGRERTTSIARRPTSSPVYGGAGTPFTLMRRMMEDMDRVFENFGFGRGLATSPWSAFGGQPWGSELSTGVWSPQVETFRRGDNIVVRADLPGLKKEDVNVEVDTGLLTISGERRDEHEENRDGYYRSERSYGQFYRAIPLPEGVNAEQCDATFNDGVLEVTLAAPKENQQRRKIQVK